MLESLSPAVKTRLDELKASLQKTLGKNLVALVAHGSAVRGGWRETTSDVDLILVVDDDSDAVLASVGPALELARFAARIETMILTKAEIPRSADCFPLLYGDVAKTSTTLVGENPFAKLAISDEHKRLRIEQELREIRIRMRRIATDMAGATNFGGAIERKLKQLRGPLWALLALRGETVDEKLDAVLDGIGKAYKIDPAPLRRAREEPKVAYATLAKLLDAALADVDAWTPGKASA
jgi:predicted nucleotidyltransferase